MIGDLLPDVALVDHEGTRFRFSDHRGRPLLIVLHRHLACLPCQEHVIAVRDHRDRLGDVLPIVVTFTDDVSRLGAYRNHLDIGFPVLADVDRALYRLLGAGRGSIRRVWSPGTIAMYARLLRHGRRLRPPTEDTRQLGADAVVDRDGRLHRVWLPASPDARPDIVELIEAIAELD